MKKFYCLLFAALVLVLGACSSTKVDRDALKQKIDNKEELTSDDYSAMVQIIQEDVEWAAKQKDVKDEDTTPEMKQKAMEMVGEIIVYGAMLDKAQKDGKLDKGTVKDLQKLKEKLDGME